MSGTRCHFTEHRKPPRPCRLRLPGVVSFANLAAYKYPHALRDGMMGAGSAPYNTRSSKSCSRNGCSMKSCSRSGCSSSSSRHQLQHQAASNSELTYLWSQRRRCNHPTRCRRTFRTWWRMRLWVMVDEMAARSHGRQERVLARGGKEGAMTRCPILQGPQSALVRTWHALCYPTLPFYSSTL